MMTTQRLLAESIEKLAQIREGNLEEEVSVFDSSFKKGVTQASGGREASPEELLGPLEPKEPALRALSDIHVKKKLYRKQIEGVFAKLMQVDSWVSALGRSEVLCTGLPGELRALYKEAASGLASRLPKAAEEVVDTPSEDPADSVPEVVADSTTGYSAAAAGEQEPDNASPPVASNRTVRRAVDAGWKRMEAAKAAKAAAAVKVHTARDPVQLLFQSLAEMKAIDFKAADYDSGIKVFGFFRKAVMQVVNSIGKEDDAVLNALEPKDLILAFLMDLHDKHNKYRNQVLSILIHLWDLDLWKAAIMQDGSVPRPVREDLQERAKLALLWATSWYREGCPDSDLKGSLASVDVPKDVFVPQDILAALEDANLEKISNWIQTEKVNGGSQIFGKCDLGSYWHQLLMPPARLKAYFRYGHVAYFQHWCTPLHYAVHCSSLQSASSGNPASKEALAIISLLLGAGANPMVKDGWGHNVFELACTDPLLNGGINVDSFSGSAEIATIVLFARSESPDFHPADPRAGPL